MISFKPNCVKSSVTDSVPFSGSGSADPLLKIRIRILLRYSSFILSKRNFHAISYLSVTLKINDQIIILPKLYFTKYNIEKSRSTGLCLSTKDSDPGDRRDRIRIRNTGQETLIKQKILFALILVESTMLIRYLKYQCEIIRSVIRPVICKHRVDVIIL